MTTAKILPLTLLALAIMAGAWHSWTTEHRHAALRDALTQCDTLKLSATACSDLQLQAQGLMPAAPR